MHVMIIGAADMTGCKLTDCLPHDARISGRPGLQGNFSLPATVAGQIGALGKVAGNKAVNFVRHERAPAIADTVRAHVEAVPGDGACA